LSVLVAAKDRLSPVASRHDMIESTPILNADTCAPSKQLLLPASGLSRFVA